MLTAGWFEEGKNAKQLMRKGLAETVLAGGYCIGCGACASVRGAAYAVGFNAGGMYEAKLKDETGGGGGDVLAAAKVCPFSDEAANEDELAERLLGDADKSDPALGRYLGTYAGHVAEGPYRKRGSSGGGVSWLLVQLMEAGVVDGVVHVKPNPAGSEGGALFTYAISRTAEEVANGAKSRYYPVEISKVVEEVRGAAGRFAFVGVPCFVKALRLLCEADEELKGKFAVLIGIVCGHLKSSRYADMFSWQLGIAPGKLRGIDFRVKTPGFHASSYSIEAKGVINDELVVVRAPAHVLFGYDWGEGFFKYKACDFCDDVFAETADVTFGDAWLEGYDEDWRGANVVVVRNRQVGEIMERGIASGALAMEAISAELCAQSQAAGLRHRRGGLSFRLEQADGAGAWRPAKRVRATSEGLTRQERKKFALRRQMADLSHEAFQSAVAGEDFGIFTKTMGPMIARYRKSVLPTFEERALRMMRRVIGRWKVKLGIRSGASNGRR